MGCIIGAKFTMLADVLRPGEVLEGDETDVTEGQWEVSQDPVTGEISNVWVPGTEASPGHPATDVRTIKCLVRGTSDGSTRGGSLEKFGAMYENEEVLRMWVSSGVKLTKRDRITNIRTARGQMLWEDADGDPLEFNISGITPIFDPFNKHIQTYVYLENA